METPDTLEDTFCLPECCPMCLAAGECKIQTLNLPHFPVTLLFAYHCQKCGYKHNEVVNGGGISAFGKRLVLRVESPDDLDRQVIMMRSSGCGGSGSGTADVCIPELNMRIGSGGGCTEQPAPDDLAEIEDAEVEIADTAANTHPGDMSFTLPNYFTTVQGILQKILVNLWHTYKSSTLPGSDDDATEAKTLKNAIVRLKQMTKGERLPFTFVLDDPLAGISIDGRGETFEDSFVEAKEPFTKNLDDQLVLEAYQRTAEQDEEFGIADMVTEGYGEDLDAEIAAHEAEMGE